MISNDKEFKALVHNIANGSAHTKENIEIAAKYLWHQNNWSRLRETPYGLFMREVDNKVPDYMLRSLYRKQILELKFKD